MNESGIITPASNGPGGGGGPGGGPDGGGGNRADKFSNLDEDTKAQARILWKKSGREPLRGKRPKLN
ncbi:hypothetical protein [Neobacillus sp. SuZ13]|uniref:hypothetical protein n=1 Tax=Neobacillus sp. SuZ13 TaxID=3047875 RepID=UPI0024BFC171|nr:hypothetical protein [Neobacillus sp. SuZ13]WHY67695.1 hypothetical protein QNH17_03310 [Neobacillus sp. SuZ13]